MVVAVATAPDLDALTLAYGKEIFARIGRSGALPFSPRWFDDLLMQWTMSDEAVKVQLFRFIDALPLLKSSSEVTRHLWEYFHEAADHLPGWMRWALPYMPRHGWSGELLARTARRNAERLARKFIAGS